MIPLQQCDVSIASWIYSTERNDVHVDGLVAALNEQTAFVDLNGQKGAVETDISDFTLRLFLRRKQKI
jgi:hypothetical protein